VGSRDALTGRSLAQSASTGELKLQGDPDRIAEWIDGADLAISVRESRPGLLAVALDDAVLDPTLWA
jgi:hypothetical protein